MNVKVYVRMRVPMLLLLLLEPLLAYEPSARELYAQGRKAEKAGHMAEAYLLYSEAAAADPNNREYWFRSQAVRSRAALESKLLLKPSGLTGALPVEGNLEPAAPEDLRQAREPLPPIELDADPSTKDFDLRGNAQMLFESVARAFGLDCVFDGDYQAGNSIRFQINDVDYRLALRALEAATGSFIVPLTEKLFLVAKDTPQKRAEAEPSVAVSVHVPDTGTAQEFTSLVTAVQQSMGLERVSWDSQNSTLVLRDRISKVLPARALLEQMINPRAQVLMEVRLLAVSRNDAVTYGIDFPTLFSLTSLTTWMNNRPTIPKGIEGLLTFGGGQSLMGIGILNPALVARLSQSSDRVLLDSRLRSVDGQPASLHVGERYPILTTGYFGAANIPAGTTNNSGAPVANFSSSAFGTTKPFGAVANPSAIVAQDFNRDGIPDFAAAAAGSDSVAVFLGKGDGTFSDPANYATGHNPSAILTGDLNADGHLDLVVADADSNAVSVLLGKGDGTFQDAQSFAVGAKPAALASADLNGDGYPDLLVANSGDNTVSILLGRGDGTFQQASTVETGSSPRSLAVADINGDGLDDLAVANYSSNDLWILLGNGDGTFRKSATYRTGNAPRAVTMGHFNQDSFIDIGVANSSSNTVSVFLGDGAGGFDSGNQFAAGLGPVALLAADFNSDTIPDIVTANSADGTLSLLLGNDNGTFQAPISITIGTGSEPVSVAYSDFNRDGYRDLITASLTTNNFSVLLGSGNGGFHDTSGNSYPSSGGTIYAPTPAFTFEDLGLSVKITPHVHGADEASLDLEIETKLLTGKSIDGVPELAQRKLQSQVTLKFGEWAVIGGLLTTQEARTIAGLAGLARVPGLGALTSTRQRDRSTDEILILLRPRLEGLPPSERVTRTFLVGSETRPASPL